MASPLGKKNASVIERLLSQPYRFAFFQAVRLLVASGAAKRLNAPDGELGGMSNIHEEPIRFRSLAGLEFPPAEIVSITKPPLTGAPRTTGERAPSGTQDRTADAPDRTADAPDQDGDTTDGDTTDGETATGRPLEFEVAFWGMFGPAGALPTHYTQFVIDRARQRDFSLRDFLDLFGHRQLSFFYRAWEKHHVAAGFERAARTGHRTDDALREMLLAIVGRGTGGLRDRLRVTDDACLYYGGPFVNRPSAESLRQILVDYLSLPVEILSLSGQWLRLPQSEQTRLGAVDGHARLGTDTVLGERTWDAISKFRIRVGPVGWEDFCRLMPTGADLVPVCQLVRSYVGCELTFDLQLILKADAVPACRFAPAEGAPHLGWNTWLCSHTPHRDSDEAVFFHRGAPSDDAVFGHDGRP